MKRGIILFVAFSATIGCKGAVKSFLNHDDIRTIDTEIGSPMPAEAALKGMKFPAGFTASLFASEPMVRQPIDMKVDARGRVWVAEAYSYMSYSSMAQDRITVLEDTDGDGTADKRTIFASGLSKLMSIEVGFGGVWVLAPPTLTFYPDADGDLKPDGPPVVHVSHWSTSGEWNMANGLAFGPDGWLYGREGQMGASTPVTSKGLSPGRMSGSIWRYHPPSGKLEVVAHGMTNPWGLDWNEDGELFASGNCNGHLWHIVGGSLYEWGFGARQFSSEYGRTPPMEVAPHYAPGKDWMTSWKERFEKTDANDSYGGGHSHCGLVICNGSAWPEPMRGHTLMSNIHGHRINEDTIDANGSTYISHRVGDPIKPADPWFKGVSLVPAADGALFISDWSDTGECHDKDGIHQDSARIFRVIPTSLVKTGALDGADDGALLVLLAGDREEPARQALKLLQYRSLQKKLSPGSRGKLVEMLTNPDCKLRMRALSALHGGATLENDSLLAALRDSDERMRAMAVRYWAERENQSATSGRILEMAATETSPRVVLHLASVTRLLPAKLARSLTTALIGRSEHPIDARTAQLLWHIQIQNPVFSSSDARPLIASCQCTAFATSLAQFLVENDGDEGITTIFTIAATRDNPAAILSVAIEMARLQKGFMTAPRQWPEWRAKWMASPDNATRGAALAAAVLFGDREALQTLRDKIGDPKTAPAEKVAALETLAAAQTDESLEIVGKAYRDKTLRIPAIRAMRYFKQASIANSLIANWTRFDDAERGAVVETLVSRKEWAVILLAAMGPDGIKPAFLSAPQARNLAESGDPGLHAAVLKNWGDPSRSTSQKDASLTRATKLLAEKVQGDPEKGHLLFSQTCGICHTLYGEGGKLGPDLTGRNRADLPSLIRSIVDPSAEVPEEGRLTIVTRTDGSIVSGIVLSKNTSAITVRSQQGDVTVKNEAIANLQSQATSPMPEGLLDGLSDPQLRDLFAYLRADQSDHKK
ncbi:MAG: PVC-type heme-binding CxxCH protein [Luteolibacter sp.]